MEFKVCQFCNSESSSWKQLEENIYECQECLCRFGGPVREIDTLRWVAPGVNFLLREVKAAAYFVFICTDGNMIRRREGYYDPNVSKAIPGTESLQEIRSGEEDLLKVATCI